MNRIWKYPLVINDSQKLNLPRGSRVLSVQLQHGQPTLWALVSDGFYKDELTISTRGTGHAIEEDLGRFVSTYQISGGSLVFHVFVKGEES